MKKEVLFSFVFGLALIISSCGTTKIGTANKNVSLTFDEQAHRGGRGLMPENTIASEINAINFNCTLEMDLQMTKDNRIVVSHDPYINALFALTPEGDTMTIKDGKSRVIYHMNYDSLIKYDVGMKFYPEFPRQRKIHAVKPLLSVLIDSVEAYAKTRDHINHYNIEIKSSVNRDGKTYPDLKTYVDSAMNIIVKKGIASRTMMQSFDVRALNMIHKNYPYVQTSYLVDANDKNDAEGYINTLGFVPDVFSPNYKIVTKELVDEFHQRGVKVIPWTTNSFVLIQELKDMGCDGAISDYPDLYKNLK